MHDLEGRPCNLLALLRSNVDQHPAGNGTPGKAGAIRIQAQRGKVNPKSNWLNNNSLECSLPSAPGCVRRVAPASAGPGGLNEQAMFVPKVAGRRSDYGPFTDYDFAVLLQGLPNVVFAYEVGRFFTRFQTG